MRILSTLCAILTCIVLNAQSNQPPPTPANDRLQAFEQRKELLSNSLLSNLKFKNIGPTIFSGRVTDIEVDPSDPSRFYVAYASGGLWYTANNGTSFEPIFDHEAVMTIGDIAVNWKTGTIWVGTGENNSSRSSYAGLGMYKSMDQGATWVYSGLPESHHIGRIQLHPQDDETIYVAVLGHLYSSNSERGVYKTTDGGQSWNKVLYVNDNCGAVDIVFDPIDPNTLYAAMWERTRRAWNFEEAGAGSGIYKSKDGGENWSLLTGPASGFPSGDGVGRIGLDVAVKDGDVIIAAILDNYFRRPDDKTEPVKGLTKEALRTMSKDDFLTVDVKDIETFLEDNNLPEEYDAQTVTEMVKDGDIIPADLVEYLEDANALLFDTDVIGAEVYLSNDGGVKWTKSHEGYIDRLYNTYGYYFGQIRISSTNPDKMYIMGVPILRTDDAGTTWKSINGDNVHVDHHALWVSDIREGHLINGNDGGINISYDDGETWIKCNSPSVGQFYYVHLDRAKNYNVYGGLQDNGIWGGPHTYEASTRWHSTGQYPYKNYLGGDGMQVQVDYRDNNTMYCGLQFGNYYRVDMSTGKRTFITPRHKLGERPFRWNWQTPILISRHQQDIIYMGSNFVHRSFDKGDSFAVISPDLTNGGRKGDVPYGTISTMHESPMRFGLLYVGTDDGNIYMTKDMGGSWSGITAGLPDNMWVSRIRASAHIEGRVYCALNGYRWDDFNPYVYVSNDYGTTWKSISDGLPSEPVNVIKEDPNHPDVLYVGTDHGVYISLDEGENYHTIGNDLPAVPVHDVVVHPDEKHLILGTHGRSLYLADLAPVYTLNNNEDEQVLVFNSMPETVRYSSRWGQRRADWAEYYTTEVTIPFYSRSTGPISWEVSFKDIVLKTGEMEFSKGLNYIAYNLSYSGDVIESYNRALEEDDDEEVRLEVADDGSYYLQPGNYKFTIRAGEDSSSTTFEVK